MVKLDDLYKKYPFIYSVDGVCYYLGFGICEKCDSPIAIHYFDEYRKVLNEIGEETIALKFQDIPEDKMELLIYYFRKVMAYSDKIVDVEALSGFRQKLNDFLEALAFEQKEELLIQLKNFVNVFYYYYKRF